MVRSTRHAEYVNPISFADLRSVLGSSFEDTLKTGIAQVFADLGRRVAEAIIEGEVESLCGPKHSRKGEGQLVRWGSQAGSVHVRGAKERITKSRVRTADGKQEIDIRTYSALNNKDILTDELLSRVGSGVSTRQYAKTLSKQLRKHGVSKSAVSRRVIECSKEALDRFTQRRWEGMQFVALLFDGVHIGKTHVVAALGVDKSGHKHVLGWQLGSTEHEVVCRDLVRKLVDAGLDVNGPYLFLLDGSKALRKAIRLVFGDHSVVQRCQEHKVRDVEGYLPRKLRTTYRIKIQAAYNQTSYRQAAQRLEKVRLELLSVSEQAANSLTEGLEDTLTLHRLGITGGVRESLRTTNSIESAFARLRQYTRNVSNWSNGAQVERWLALSLYRVEAGFRTLPGYRQLAKLQRSIKQQHTASQSAKA